MKINLELYRSFVAIYHHQSVTKAAQANYLTQPAMSQHLASLESIIGSPLFIREHHQMLPTTLAKELYVQLIGPLEQLAAINLPPLKRQTLRLGAPLTYFNHRLLPLLAGASLDLDVSFGEADQLAQRLLTQQVDLIITTKPTENKLIRTQLLETEDFYLVSSEPFKQDSLELEARLSAQTWLSYSHDLPIIRRFWQTHFDKRPPFTATHILPDLDSLSSAVQKGMGISLLPSYLIQTKLADQRLFRLPDFSVSNDLFIAYPVESADRTLIQTALALLTQT